MAFDSKNMMDENRFWLQILGDHSRFIYSSLSPKEENEIKKAGSFITMFDDLLAKSRQGVSAEALNEEAYTAVQDLRAFKLHLISRLLTEKIEIDLTPVFLNHMTNELEQYLYILEAALQNKPAFFHPVHLHIVWMLDGAGHAQTIADRLEINYRETRLIAQMFEAKFNNEYQKALEMSGFLRTGLKDFPSLDQLNANAVYEMKDFMEFLSQTEKKIRSREILSVLNPLMLDHMFREECYYLSILSAAANTDKPDCDPAMPRNE